MNEIWLSSELPNGHSNGEGHVQQVETRIKCFVRGDWKGAEWPSSNEIGWF